MSRPDGQRLAWGSGSTRRSRPRSSTASRPSGARRRRRPHGDDEARDRVVERELIDRGNALHRPGVGPEVIGPHPARVVERDRHIGVDVVDERSLKKGFGCIRYGCIGVQVFVHTSNVHVSASPIDHLRGPPACPPGGRMPTLRQHCDQPGPGLVDRARLVGRRPGRTLEHLADGRHDGREPSLLLRAREERPADQRDEQARRGAGPRPGAGSRPRPTRGPVPCRGGARGPPGGPRRRRRPSPGRRPPGAGRRPPGCARRGRSQPSRSSFRRRSTRRERWPRTPEGDIPTRVPISFESRPPT